MKSKPSSPNQDITKALKEMGGHKAAYPREMFEARRAAFMEQVDQYTEVENEQEAAAKDQQIVKILQTLKTGEGNYPPNLWASRRSAFIQQVEQARQASSFWYRLQSAFQTRQPKRTPASTVSSINMMLTSLIVTSVTAFFGYIVYGILGQSASLSRSGGQFEQPVPILVTGTLQAEIICKPGFVPPLCLARAFERSSDLTFQGNGAARPAVAKDTVPGYEEIHRASYLNDGLYGPGTSWISNSPNSWIKIDLGKPTTINTISFGRDRLGQLNDRDPGQFVIAVALNDNVYADGNSSNDHIEYLEVFRSQDAGFNGKVSGSETITVQINELAARYIKITFQNPGTAVDEVEVFLLESPSAGTHPTRTPKDHRLLNTATPYPTNTPLPTRTPLPTSTFTLAPTNTPLPTNTATPIPTNTPTPIPTNTPLPTDTPTPIPTDTPLPTDTRAPIATPTTLPDETPVPTEFPIGVLEPPPVDAGGFPVYTPEP